MEAPEFKKKPSVAIALLKRNLNLILPAKEMTRIIGVKKTDQDTVEINLLNKQAANLGSNRSYTHSGSINGSTKTTQTFTTITHDFAYSLKQADRDSVFTLAEQTQAQFLSGMIAIIGSLETAMLTALNTNKSQVSNTPSLGDWDSSNFIYSVDQADKNVVFQRLKGFMGQNYYPGMLDTIGDEGIKQWFEYLANQGGGNSSNLGFQLSNISMVGSPEMSPVDNKEGWGYIAPSGTIGLMDWIPEMNRTGFGNPYQNGGAYWSIPDPWGLGLTFAIHETSAGADNNSNDGERQDININVQMSIDHSFIVPTFSTANLSSIYKYYLNA